MVYGVGAKGNLIPLIRAIQRGLPVWLPDFHNKRSMVDVNDVVAAAVKLVESPEAHGIYTVTDGETYSIGRILHEIRMALGRRDPWITVPAWCFGLLAKMGDQIGKRRGKRFLFDSDKLAKLAGNAWFSSERLTTELGFVPSRTLSDAIPGMIDALGTGQDGTNVTQKT